jgi:hypothetical protein
MFGPGILERNTVKLAIRFSKSEEAKALPILLRHSPGMVLANRTYVLSDEAVSALRDAGVRFEELSTDADAPSLTRAVSGARI